MLQIRTSKLEANKNKTVISTIVFSGDLRTLLKQIRTNAHVQQSHKIALFWINIGMSYDEVT